jgi:menaquinone-dependent protoporphyrinogen IX oxidase
MSKRVLVAYATRTGSTVGVAAEIGKTLEERGFAADVKPLRERPSLEGYDAAVIGSAVNGGTWLPEAMNWVESNASTLCKLPVAVFCVHGMNPGTDDDTSLIARWACSLFGGSAEGDMRDWDTIHAWAEQVRV